MNKKILLGIFALVIGTAVVATSRTAYAYRGDYTQKGPNCTAERHEAMEQAFENNDYQAWANLMTGRGRVTQVINEENFPRFAEAHRLAEEGNYEEADVIREELGLRTRNGDAVGAGYMGGNGQRRGMNASN